MYNDSGIYCYRNKINGKLYVGQAINLKKRYQDFKNNNKRYSGSAFQNAINKYGKENFQYTILTHCKPSELNYYEAFYIQRLKTNIHNFGYNLTSGGNSRYQLSETCKKNIRESWTIEKRKKQSENQKGALNNNYGKKWNDEQKKHGSKVKKEQAKKKFFQKNGFHDYELPEKIKQYVLNNSDATCNTMAKLFHVSNNRIKKICEDIGLYNTVKKITENFIKSKIEKSKNKIVQCDIDNHDIILNIFPSLSEAETITNIKTIKHCVYGKQGHAGGYFWRYANDDETVSENYNEQYLNATSFKRKICKEAKQRMFDKGVFKRENLYKKVYQYDIMGNIVKIYDSVKQTENNGFDRTQVCACCNDNYVQKTHKGYTFSYKELTHTEILNRFKRINLHKK